MAWQFILTDLNGGIHGEINAAEERKVSLPLMRAPSVSFTLPLSNEWANTVMDTDCLLKAYRYDEPTSTKTLGFIGPIITTEEAADGTTQGIAVTAAGPFWRMSKRLLGTTRAGFSQGIPTPIDLGLAAHNILDTLNGVSFTGIGKGSRGAVTTGAFGPWHLKVGSEAIADLTAGINSFEFVVDPIEPASEPGGVGGWPRIGNMRIAGLIGNTLPDLVFEYGTDRANVGSYTRSKSRDGMITRAVISVSGWPETPEANKDLIIRSADTLSARGLLEEVVSDASVIDDTLRTEIADFHLLHRKNPREIVTFVPTVNSRPAPFVDYMPGDVVRARAVISGSVRFDAMFRIWGASFSIDQAGNETIELELIRP